jgi:drug/metabolite transporter (DMT)-like permease
VTDKTRRLLLTAALIGVAAVWGSTFVMVQAAVADYPVFSFLAWRFAIATVAFAVIFPKTFGRMQVRTIGTGVIAGLLLTGG